MSLQRLDIFVTQMYVRVVQYTIVNNYKEIISERMFLYLLFTIFHMILINARMNVF